MATRSEIEKQMAALQAELDKADTDDEIWVKGDDNREYKVTGRRATGILGKLGLLDDGKADDDGGEPDEDEPDEEPAGGYFRKRK